MSKNMTRKGLAFGAGLSMVAATVVGLPAQASDQTLTMSPSAGTGFNTLNTSKFTLTTVVSGTTEYSALRYRILNEDEKDLTVEMKKGSTAGNNTVIATGLADGAANRVGDYTLAVTKSTTGLDLVTTDPASNAASVFTITFNDGVNTRALFSQGQTITISSVDIEVGSDTSTDQAVPGSNDVLESELEAALDGTHVITAASVSSGVQSVSFEIADDWAGASAADEAIATGDLTESGEDTFSFTITSTNANTETTNSDDFVVEPEGSVTEAASGTPTTLEVSVGNYTTNTTISVQAFIDSNGDNKLTAGEKYSAVQEINFYDPANITASVAFSPVLIGDTSLNANITFSNGINVRQIDADLVKVNFAGPTSAYAALGGQDGSAPSAAWVTAAGAYRASLSGDLNASGSGSDVLENAAYKATVIMREAPSGNYTNVGQFATTTVGTALAASNTLVARVVNAANALSTAAAVVDADADAVDVFGAAGAGTGKIRVDEIDAATAEVQLFVGTDAAKPAGLASRPIEVTVTPGSNITATDKVIVGGEDITTALGATSFVVTTGSDGYVKFTVDPGAVDEGERITIGAVSGGQSFNNLVITFTKGTFALYEVATGDRAIVAKGSTTFNYQVADEFGIAPADNRYSVVVTDLANENRTTSADFSYTSQVVAGKASVTVVDNGAGTGTLRVRAALHLNGSAVSGVTVDSAINIVADATVASLTAATPTYGTGQYDPAASPVVDNRTKLVVSTATFANYDSRFATPGTTAPAVTDATKVVVGATAKNAAGTNLVGVPVTFAAKGFLFQSGTRYAMDTITVMSGASGLASVTVWSNVGGAQTIAITSGAATASQALTYAGGTSTAASFTVSAPATSEAGKTADVTITVLDKFGNPASGVAVTLFSTGPGYLINTTGTTLSNGKFTTKLLIGSNDSGTAVVSAVVTLAGVETIKTTEIKVGAAAGKVNVGSFNGKLVVYASGLNGARISWKVGGVWGSAVATSNYAIFNRPTPRAGVTVSVDIYVNGVKTLTKSVLTR